MPKFTPDVIVSYLRTGVPIVWGWLVAQLLGHWDWLAKTLESAGVDLQSGAVVGAVTGLVVFLWYALWRWLEPRLPDSVTRLVLGSSRAPAYAAPRHAAVDEGGAFDTNLLVAVACVVVIVAGIIYIATAL